MSFNDGFNIRAVPWPSNTPVSGNSLVYDGTKWVAANVSGSGGGGTGDITAVNAGTNLIGGGDTGDVTISLSSSVTDLTNLQTTTLTASHVTGTDLKIDYIDFNNNLVLPTFQTGRLHYDPNTSDLIYDTNVSGVTINIGQQTVVRAKNTSGAQINKGKFVRIYGGSGSFPVIQLADWSTENLSANTIGAVMQDVLQNGFTYVLLNGILDGVNTNSAIYTDGDLLYLSSSGDFTKGQPLPPKQAVRLGQVIRAQTNNGSIFVKVDNGYELGELHDVYTGSVTNGDLLVYNSSLTAWNNSKTLSGSYTITGTLNVGSVSGTTAQFTSVSSNKLNFNINSQDVNINALDEGSGLFIRTVTNLFQVVGASGFEANSALGQQSSFTPNSLNLNDYTGPKVVISAYPALDMQLAGEMQLNGDAGTSGYVLTSNGSGAAPTWQLASGGLVSGSGFAQDRVLVGSGSNGVDASSELTFYDNGPVGYKSLRIANADDSSALFVDHTMIDNTGGNLDIAVSNASSLYIGRTGIPVTINGNVAIDYTPSTPSDWNGTAPTTVAEALDRMAALLKALNSGTGP
jgi:hypothetical protein